MGADAERKGWQRFSLNFNVACPKADRKSDKDTPPGIGPEAVPASSAGPAPGTPPPSPGRPAAPPVKEPTSSPVPPPEAAVPAPEGEALPDPGAPEGAPAAEAPGLPEGPEARIPAMERPTRIRAAGPPHVGGPGATVPARVPSSRALERPAGADTTRRIPGIRPGN
ncbi:MAG: hypothetical protein FJ098_16150 [Deltaproteobacteria bacterium]|nr:hypothetical protein [Deltaproteobacteria bacterium]